MSDYPDILVKFDELPTSEKDKIWFIHMNHSNPLLDPSSSAYQQVIDQGYHVAREGFRLPL